MGSKSNYLESIAIKLLLGAPFTFTPTPNVWIAAYKAMPSDSGGGSEMTGGGYARVQKANTMAEWPWVNGKKANASQILFPVATAAWPAVVAFGIMDAPSAGNLLFWVEVPQPLVIYAGAALAIAVSGLQLSES